MRNINMNKLINLSSAASVDEAEKMIEGMGYLELTTLAADAEVVGSPTATAMGQWLRLKADQKREEESSRFWEEFEVRASSMKEEYEKRVAEMEESHARRVAEMQKQALPVRELHLKLKGMLDSM